MKYPLMRNNILREDLDAVINHLKQDDPILTNGPNVLAFEEEWSAWLGVKYSVFVNSGSSANLLTMAVLKIRYPEGGEVIVPTLTWSSDISSVLHNGFTPVFVDTDPHSLAMNSKEVLFKITENTRAVFLTHAQGFDGLTDELINELKLNGYKSALEIGCADGFLLRYLQTQGMTDLIGIEPSLKKSYSKDAFTIFSNDLFDHIH